MTRKFKTVDYENSLQQIVMIGDLLPEDHSARFIVNVIAMVDLSAIYAQFGSRGGEPHAPEILLGLLFYGYMTGVQSSRKIEKATYESIPYRFIAGGWHPDHDTIAAFRQKFLPQITELMVQMLLIDQEARALQLGTVSLESEKGAGEGVPAEMEFRHERLSNLAPAKAALELRAEERYQAEKAAYEARLRERKEKAQRSGRKPGGREPKPTKPGPRDKDQYNFTDPESRIMKNSHNSGFDQHYNVQIAVDQEAI